MNIMKIRPILRVLATKRLIAIGLITGFTLANALTSAYAEPKSQNQTPLPKIAAKLAVGAFPQSVTLDKSTNRIYVANDAGGSVSVIDGKTDKVIHTIAVGSGSGSEPNYIAIDEQTNKLYVANSGDGTVSVVDGKTNKVVGAPIVVGNAALPLGCVSTCTDPGSDSYSIVLNHKTHKIYVGNFVDATVVVIDAKTNKVKGAPISVNDVPYILAVNEKTNKIYMANYYDATVQVLDGETDTIVATIKVGTPSSPDGCYATSSCTDWGSLPTSVTVNEKTNKIYVTNLNDGSVQVIDGNTDTLAGSPVKVGVGAFFATLDQEANLLYVVNQFDSSLSLIDLISDKVIGSPASVGTGFTPAGCNVFNNTCTGFGSASTGVTVNHETGKIYVSNGLDDKVVVLKILERGQHDN